MLISDWSSDVCSSDLRPLVWARFAYAALHQCTPPRVHAFADLVILVRGFHIGGALCLDELALEGHDFLGVIELDHIHSFLGPDRMENASTSCREQGCPSV